MDHSLGKRFKFEKTDEVMEGIEKKESEMVVDEPGEDLPPEIKVFPEFKRFASSKYSFSEFNATNMM
jgi:hypothetical protein